MEPRRLQGRARLLSRNALAKKYAYIRIWLGNGQTFFNDFKYPLMLATALKIYFPNASIIQLGLIALLIFLIFMFIGWFDLKFIKISQTQAEITTGKYNPYFSKLKKHLNTRVTIKK